MSKKPYIKIVYPDASPVAMLLTEAMVRRASGKRVVATESTERESTGQDLFAGTLCCVTETSVELTLNLAPEAMDFALATLIAKNLTQAERDKAMEASDSLELDALFTPRTEDVANADTRIEEEQKKQIKLADPQITQKMAAALYAAGCSKKSKLLDPFVRGLLADIEIKDNEDEYYISLSALIATKKKMEEWKLNDPFALYDQFQGSIPSWDDVEKAAQTIGQKSEPAGEVDQDSDIDPGLLNDLDEDKKEGGEE